MPGVEKEGMLKEVRAKVEGAPYILFAKFRGLTAGDMGALRRTLERSSKSCFVAKQTILKKALEASGIPFKKGGGPGSLMLITVEKDPQIASKTLVEFAKEKPGFELSSAYAEGKVFDASFIKELSKLPSKRELLAKVLGGMKGPIVGLVLDLRSLLSSFLVVLNEVSKKK
jgi:large subunit ribosomal protein L10